MKYNKSEIMKRAWELKRIFLNRTFSVCLRMAWNEAKQEAEEKAFEGKKFENGMQITMLGVTRTLNRWTKNGYDRVYINYARKNDGYIDLVSGKAVLGNKYSYLSKIAEAIQNMVF